LLALLDALAIGQAHLVGLSLGANIALATAAFHPDRTSGTAGPPRRRCRPSPAISRPLLNLERPARFNEDLLSFLA
jgi:hypothetical protein